MLITEGYREQLRNLHDAVRWGAAGKSWAPIVERYAHELRAQTVLDYGCGRGTLRAALIGFDVAEYDPGISGKDALPAPADLVVCTDVLEHVEPGCLHDVLMHIRVLANKGAFFSIALAASKVDLLDGRNSHLIVQDEYWWIDQLRQHGFAVTHHHRGKGVKVWSR